MFYVERIDTQGQTTISPPDKRLQLFSKNTCATHSYCPLYLSLSQPSGKISVLSSTSPCSKVNQ